MLPQHFTLARNVTAVKFTVNVKTLQLNCVESNEVSLNELFWKIRLCKSSNMVKAYLVSNIPQEAPKWSCIAESVIKLVDRFSTRNIVKNITEQSFNATNPVSYGIEFVDWNTLLTNFTYNNEALFKIKILADFPIRNFLSEQLFARYQVKVIVGSNFTYVYSPTFDVRGIGWTVLVQKKTLKNYLAIFLFDRDIVNNESWEATVSFTLAPWYGSASVVKRTFTRRFNNKYGWGYPEFLEFDRFINPNNRYVVNGTAKIQVEVDAKNPKILSSVYRTKVDCEKLNCEVTKMDRI